MDEDPSKQSQLKQPKMRPQMMLMKRSVVCYEHYNKQLTNKCNVVILLDRYTYDMLKLPFFFI